MKKVRKCPLSFPVFPTGNKGGFFSLSLGEAVTHSFALQMCSLCLGRLLGAVTLQANVTTGPHLVAKLAGST